MNYTYPEALKKYSSTLSNNKEWVLATSNNNNVTARMISTVCIDGKLLFQTDKKFQKYIQIKNNSNVALCIGNCSIEGLAKDNGHSSDEANETFVKYYKTLHESSFKKYGSMKDEVIIEINPKKVKYWEYDTEGKPWQIEIDLEKQKVKCNEYKI